LRARRFWRWLERTGRHPPPFRSRRSFAYRKKPARREYVRVHLRTAEDGTLEAAKFPREGAGLLSSLIDTDGVVELGEDVTKVDPGTIVSCLPYASLL
jgi:molybdopterin molybdotransferase